jgi:hypothetical protein
MHKQQVHPLLKLLLILVLTAVACNIPAAGRTPAASGPEATFTALAQTIQVILTQTAQATGGDTSEVSTNTPAAPNPTNTSTPRPPTVVPASPVPPTAVPCDLALFVSDVTIPDGTNMAPGKVFTKTWRLKNVGACTWTTSYAMVFDSGNAMSGPATSLLTDSVAPGETIDLSVDLTAPSTAGSFRGNWKMRNASGAIFGLGGNSPFYIQINVVIPTTVPTTTVYDFLAKMCSADWANATTALPCPGLDSDNAGFVIRRDAPRLETGATTTLSALETHPQWIDNGVIQGTYETIAVKTGYRFKATIGCLYGASSCNANFFIKYSADGGAWTDLGPAAGWNEVYDSSMRTLDIDLSSLNGKNVQFMLQVKANGPIGQDWALWLAPRITNK